MSILLRNFAFSAKEFKSIKSIVAAALLIALHTVLAVFVSIQVTPTLRISVSFLANCAIGYMFGPVMGFVCGGLVFFPQRFLFQCHGAAGAAFI